MFCFLPFNDVIDAGDSCMFVRNRSASISFSRQKDMYVVFFIKCTYIYQKPPTEITIILHIEDAFWPILVRGSYITISQQWSIELKSTSLVDSEWSS